MDDLSSTLSSFLNDPESMSKIQDMANSLFNDKTDATREPKEREQAQIFGGDMPDISAITKIMGLMKTQGTDQRAGLLLALKPHLSKERALRVDKAVKILKLVSLVPLLKDEGLLNF